MNDPDYQKEKLDEIAQDRARGASQLARRCLEILATYAQECPASNAAELNDKLRDFGRRLQAIRPNMAPVQHLVGRLLDAVDETPSNTIATARDLAISVASDLNISSERCVLEVCGHAAALVEPGQTIMTHSLSSTMLAVFRTLADKRVRAIITESRPLQEGRTLAGQLSKLGIATRYLTDAQMGVFIGDSDLAMVGADSVLGDGSAVNKAGTYLLALAARDCGVPFYVCCETFKFTPALPGDIDLEEMDASELHPMELAFVTPRNVYFDITPAKLITGWITENGVSKTFPSPCI